MDQAAANALIIDALTAPAADLLYQTVSARSPITVEPSDDSTWGSSTVAGSTTIFVAPTQHPAESLYHELLHADLKLGGYRQHATYARITDNNSAKALAAALDNELQHHRIFPAFIAAGFDPELFYHDGDATTFASIRNQVKRCKPAATTAAAYFLMYLSVIAPGGHGDKDKREQLDRFFRLKVPANKLQLVIEAADKVRAWGMSTDNDPGCLTAEIIIGLGDFDGWWIGASQNFPGDGHFTGAPFTAEDVHRFLAAQT